MHAYTVLRKKKNTVKNFIKKPIAAILLFSVTVSFVIGFVSISRSTSLLKKEIQNNILNTAEKSANDFSAQFNHMEGLTDSLASYVTTNFDMEAYSASPEEYMNSFEKDLAELLIYDLQTTKNGHSLYVTFSPDLTEVAREVWYIINEDGNPEDVSFNYEKKDKNFSLPYKDDMAYFFEPQNKDYGIWTPPYLDIDINQEVLSYSRAVYVDDLFIGVAGADITADDILREVTSMHLYSGGYATILDSEYKMIVEPTDISDEEKEVITSRVVDNTKSSKGTSGVLEYKINDDNKIIAYSNMSNGWTMAVVQSQKEAYKPVIHLTTVFLLLTAVIALVLTAFLYLFSRPFIKKQTALERQNQEKDLMLMYQSRHSKIGEMFYNMTRQWKQPLNTINLIMTNLLDSYRENDFSEERLEKSVDNVAGIVEKISETITDFSEFLEPMQEKKHFDASSCVYAAISFMESSINHHKIKFKVNNNYNGQIYGYYNDLVQIIFNILSNARDAIALAPPDERTITIDITQVNDNIEIQVTNNGDKIPEEFLEKIYDPYFTTKKTSEGTGLGLFISRKIAEERMNGKLHIENTADGVLCTVRIPAEESKNA